jgi:hypothetical protein
MKQIRTEDAVGHVLCHDMTQIVKGVSKDAAFRKGHIVREEDIPVLLSLGKDHLYVWEANEDMIHENDAAAILYKICAGANMHPTDVKEGKIEAIADCDGVLLIDTDKLHKINSVGEMMIATRHNGTMVKSGDKLAGTRVIPMIIRKEKMEEAEKIGSGVPILTLKPFSDKKVAIIATGNEVFHQRIPDTFTPVVEEKVAEFGGTIYSKTVLPDDPDLITEGILTAIRDGAEAVICTGGMSVDPDDKTPLAIRNSGARIVSYGAPVLPGAMFLLAYYDDRIPVMGLPGCVMYGTRTIFDIVLPRVMVDVQITQKDLAALGPGGLCLDCGVCTYPNCGFGKGNE